MSGNNKDFVADNISYQSKIDFSKDERWISIKKSISQLQYLQNADGSLTDQANLVLAVSLIRKVASAVIDFIPVFAHDRKYLEAVAYNLNTWADTGVGVPDFYEAILEFHPENNREDKAQHLVVFAMYTQNGSRSRYLEAVIIEVIWPDFIKELEETDYSNDMFVPIKFIDYTAGYDTNSAVLFPETVAMRAVPNFTWGAIFADREAARYRKVVKFAAEITKLELPDGAKRIISDQVLAQETFIMWDLIHDRTHMRGDLPFDPFMIKQRMPYFLYSLEELRCDLTAFRECVKIEQDLGLMAYEKMSDIQKKIFDRAKLVQYAIVFDRIFRFAITGSRMRNYDGLGGQLLFAWMHQKKVLHWTNNSLSIDWEDVPNAVVELADSIDNLYWQSIDRPKVNHWLAAYKLISDVLEPNPSSIWVKGVDHLPVNAATREMVDLVLDDEFPLSMFYEALDKKLHAIVESTKGITGDSVI